VQSLRVEHGTSGASEVASVAASTMDAVSAAALSVVAILSEDLLPQPLESKVSRLKANSRAPIMVRRNALVVLIIACGCGGTTADDVTPTTVDSEASDTQSDSATADSGTTDSGTVDASVETSPGDAPTEVALDSAACVPDKAPPGDAKCPSACTGGCKDGNVCVIDCTGMGKCNDRTITCPPSYACSLVCKGVDACDTTIVKCASPYACSVSCEGTDACGDMQLQCGDGSCTMSCTGDACTGLSAKCGAGKCSATCTGTTATTLPTLTCGSSCACGGC
jgi:hypothetical protein